MAKTFCRFACLFLANKDVNNSKTFCILTKKRNENRLKPEQASCNAIRNFPQQIDRHISHPQTAATLVSSNWQQNHLISQTSRQRKCLIACLSRLLILVLQPLSTKTWCNIWVVVVVKRSAYSPSTPMIHVRILLTPTVFSVKFVYEKNENKKAPRRIPDKN